MKKRVLVIAAHSDDEALGCGGTLARHAREKDDVYALFMTDGVGARGDTKGAKARADAAHKAAKALGIKDIMMGSFPDNAMDCVPLLEIVQFVESAIRDIKPHVIYTHHAGDLNIDHVLTSRAVLTACRPLPGSKVEAIYGFEVLSSTEWAGPAAANAFCPAHFVNIEEDYAAKVKALKAYQMEMRTFPHPRSPQVVEALAVLRGSQAGVKRAEAFTVLRTITR